MITNCLSNVEKFTVDYYTNRHQFESATSERLSLIRYDLDELLEIVNYRGYLTSDEKDCIIILHQLSINCILAKFGY